MGSTTSSVVPGYVELSRVISCPFFLLLQTSLTAWTMHEISGVSSPIRGVGTEMLIQSNPSRSSNPSVAFSRPDLVCLLSSASFTSGLYDLPSCSCLTLFASVSIPVTEKPLLANSRARGNPMYPNPSTPTFACLFLIFSASWVLYLPCIDLSVGCPDCNHHSREVNVPFLVIPSASLRPVVSGANLTASAGAKSVGARRAVPLLKRPESSLRSE